MMELFSVHAAYTERRKGESISDKVVATSSMSVLRYIGFINSQYYTEGNRWILKWNLLNFKGPTNSIL
jgi:hypothetical protein